MTIKVGQIYNIPYLGGKVVVTWVRADNCNFTIVREDGYFFSSSNTDNDWELIAEYPTWQEAVNSKEFNNGKQ